MNRKRLHRREFLSAAAVLAAAPARPAPAARPVRLGVIGTGDRGQYLMKVALQLGTAEITAVCDIDEARATRAQSMVEEATGKRPIPYTRGPEDYRRLLERQDVDAVIVTTPQNLHGYHAIAAMNAGKHVGSETPCAYSVEQCWELVETKEKTGRRYMLLENYPYARSRLMVLNMAHTGAFGEVTYGESSYIHDTRSLLFKKDGTLTWRGGIARERRGDVYPTHALAPVSLWMGINRGDRLTTLVSMDNGTKGVTAYARDTFGKDHPAADPNFFQKHDTTITLVRTANEKLIVLRYDPGAARPAGGWEQLQGTRGGYDTSPGRSLVYLAGRTKGWEPLEKYRPEFDHPFWRAEADAAAQAFHEGGDYFVLREFLNALREDREPPIDVYDGATWSTLVDLTSRSIRGGNVPQQIPDFLRGRWKSRKLEGFGI